MSYINAYIWNHGEGSGNPLQYSCLKNPVDCSLSGSFDHWVGRVGHDLATKPPSPWNLERWHWWTYLQGSNGDTDIEERLTGAVGEGEGGTIWESGSETYTLCKTDSQWELDVRRREPRAGALWQPRGLVWGGRREGGARGGDICIPMADSWGSMAKKKKHNVVK